MPDMGFEHDSDSGQDSATGAPGATSSGQPLVLGVPAPGESLTVTVQEGQAFALDLGAQGAGAAQGAGIERDGDDLLIVFPEAGSIRLEGFIALSEADTPPRLILPDGSEIGADQLLALLGDGPGLPVIETAAGAETGAGEAVPSGGGHGYSDDLGGLTVAGLIAAGVLDSHGRICRVAVRSRGRRGTGRAWALRCNLETGARRVRRLHAPAGWHRLR